MFETDVSKVENNLDQAEIGGELHVASLHGSWFLILQVNFLINPCFTFHLTSLTSGGSATAFLPQRRGYTVYYVVKEDVNHSTSQTFHRYSAPWRWHVKFLVFIITDNTM